MRSVPAFAIAACVFFYSGVMFCEAGSPARVNPDDIEEANRLGEEFQRLGPWTRKKPQGDGFYGIPQPQEYLATPQSQLPQDESGSDSGQYPLCYNPYAGSYEYCYPRDSSYFRSRFSSPGFRSWWRQGGNCPSGHHFRQGEGCYRN